MHGIDRMSRSNRNTFGRNVCLIGLFCVMGLCMTGICGMLSGCATSQEGGRLTGNATGNVTGNVTGNATGNANVQMSQTDDVAAGDSAGNVAGLTYQRSEKLQYATEFSLDYYVDEKQQEYACISIRDEQPILVVPKNCDVDEVRAKCGSDSGMTFVKSPECIYIAASQVMDVLVALNKLDAVKYSAVKEKDWYIEEAAAAMASGKICYAGKYSAPDYELLLAGGCDLAVVNMMIYHSPQVIEKMQSLNIPVLVDHSSFEQEPLGKTEWVKVYGALLGMEEAANRIFEEQQKAFDAFTAKNVENRPTVAFFYVASNGEIKVRKSSDSLPKMIEMAGGEYALKNLGVADVSASSTMTLQMEEFYAMAKDADYLVYNSTIDGELGDISDLVAKNSLFANFTAVQNKNVYCISKNLYQSSMEFGEIIGDFQAMMQNRTDMKYLYRLE